MDIRRQIQLKRIYSWISFSSILVVSFYMFFYMRPLSINNIFIDAGIVLGFTIVGFVFLFLSYSKDFKIPTMIKEKAANCLKTDDYYFFMLYYHKTYREKPKSFILQNLSDKAQKDLNPSEFERFTQQMQDKKPIDKNRIFFLILVLLTSVLVIILLVKSFINEFWGSGSYFTWYIMPLLFFSNFITSISNLPAYEKLNTELEQMIGKE